MAHQLAQSPGIHAAIGLYGAGSMPQTVRMYRPGDSGVLSCGGFESGHTFTEMIDAPTNAHRYRVTDRSVLVISSGPYGHPAGATGVHARRTATLPEAVGRRQRGSAMFAAKPHEAEQELPKSIPEPRNVTRECRRQVTTGDQTCSEPKRPRRVSSLQGRIPNRKNGPESSIFWPGKEGRIT